ncbi:MAG: TonB-dependent receptor plug domain-containing protein [Kofleriaceae bacterium]|nr:MAG: TonB-dependent receptor plug domain-containing protein [Kofleriaceae bacterium]MBZ0235185.1 TonB-dependent receptor [Kofleriaceae bacterium]
MSITRTSKLLLSAVLGTGSLLGLALTAPPAHAQGTTGSIQGVVTDTSTGDALAGVTIVVTSGQVSQTAITEDDGSYRITGLMPGDYLVTFFFGDTTIERKNINVGVDKTTPVFQKINTQAAVAETIVIEDKPPAIDPTSTSQGITIDQEYTKNIPVPGRTFESTLGAAAGSQGDGLGVAFSGSTSLENQYYVDGVNTTGLRYGTSGSPVINNFIEEIEVITGGYNAEYGRATGAVVNVVTITGDNTLKGEVFASVRPGLLVAEREFTPFEGASIDTIGNLDYSADAGFVLAGPIVKDKLWFALGVAPTANRTKITRSTKRRMDCQQQLPSGELSACDPRSVASGGFADGTADVDPDTGFTLYEELGRRNLYDTSIGAYMLGKLNYAVRPEHQGQLSFNAAPGRRVAKQLYGLPQSGDYTISGATTDVAAKWTSKFNDNKTEVEAVIGWHRDSTTVTPRVAAAGVTPYEDLIFGNLGVWSDLGYEDASTKAGCTDNAAGDLYPLIENCPDLVGHGYSVGGLGSVIDDRDNRYSAKLALTQRVKAMGSHEIKAGVDVDDNRLSEPRTYTGGVFFQNFQDRSQIYTNRFVQVAPVMTDDPKFDEVCPHTPAGAMQPVQQPCRYIGQTGEGSQVQGQTVNWSAYVRDSWQIRPNLTFNAGLRYEEQRLRYAEYLRDDIDISTNQPFGKNAMSMTNMWAPRLGLLYDWTKEGRSKIYGHWGRFYESIPMNINSRSFAGEVFYRQVYDYDQCGDMVPGYGSPSGNGCTGTGGASDIIGINGTLVAPGIKPQYMDERILGVEYELAEDLKLGIAYQNRGLGRVIEDVSTDGAATYVIANPGEWGEDAEADLMSRIEAEDDPAQRARLETLLRQFRGIRKFDAPKRDYHALQFTVTRRFSKALYMQGSYTYSKTKGNFPGLISYDNGQVDPNISSQYDLIELMANRYGSLPQDKPHYIKLDGYYQFDLKQAGTLTTGARLRALSGEPRQALARHWLYGPNESFLLPRGTIGRTQFETGLDVHVGYARKLKGNMELEVYGDIFNVFNDQGIAGVSDAYSVQSASNPIVGGTYEDLIFAKENDLQTGRETSSPIRRNPNYGNTTARYAPLTVQFGARLSF